MYLYTKFNHMRFFSLVLGLMLTSASLFAQTPACNPDPSIIDTSGVFPAPYDSVTLTGGITESACIGSPFEFVFTISNSAPFNLNGTPIELAYVKLLADGAGMTGLPIGMDYACNPPDCKFNFGTVGCAVITGTAAALNTPGMYPLTIYAKIPFGLAELDVTFPGPLYPGQYLLEVEENGSPDCFVGNEDVTFARDLKVAPQPFETSTDIQFFVDEPGDVDVKIFDMTGRMVDYRALNLGVGQQSVGIDATDWAQGVYTFVILKDNQRMTGRLVRL
jgi:Secretion system C-terminal sorting domain